MPFWNKKEEELPEELRNLTAEQLMEKLKQGDQSVETIAALKAQLDEANVKNDVLATEFGEVKQRLESIEANTPPPGGGGGGGPGDPPAPTSFLDDENAAFNERFSKGIAPVLQTTLQIGANAARTQAEQSNPLIFKKWGSEIEEVLKSSTLVQRANPEFWTNIVDMVKGRHLEEVALEVRKGEGDFFTEGVGGDGAPPLDPDKDKKPTLTDEEKGIAKKMGISEENYLKTKQGIRVEASVG